MKQKLADVLSITILFFSLAALFALIRTNLIWGDVYFEQILINVGHGLINVGQNIVYGYLLWTLLPALAICIIMAVLTNKNRYLLITSVLCLIYVVYKIQLVPFLIYRHTPTALYEQEYVFPQDIAYSFPENKRNLIVLYMESMEKDYANPKLAGENLLPNLSKLAAENISFDGYHQLQNQDYSIAGMTTYFCSVPFKLASETNYTTYHNFMPGLLCYPEILKQHGYRTYFLKGTSLEFARTGMFLQTHGFEDVIGKTEIHKLYGVDWQQFQGTSWGLRDSVLYDLAKQRLTELAASGQPFLFSFLTLDTHGPDIYLDQQCLKRFNDSRDVIACADKMMGEFIEWIKQQDFYENTTIVILGDHVKTGKNDLYPQHKNREIVNIIINPLVKKTKTNTRKWTSFDMAPTILQAIGIEIPDGKFGLGRSLFSPYPTIREEINNNLDIELMKTSKIYDSFNTIENTFEPLYHPYPAWGELISGAENIRPYASFAEVAMDCIWLDTMSFTLPEFDGDHITFDFWFKILFMINKQREFKVYANGQEIAAWNFENDIVQPIHKTLSIPAKLIKDDHKLLLEFRNDGAGYTLVSIGQGVLKFSLSQD